MRISHGIPQKDLRRAAELYWEAFGGKLGAVLRPRAKAIAFIIEAFDGDHAICAHDSAGNLIGLTGFRSFEGALVDGSDAQLRAVYGWWGATWRAAMLRQLERDADNDRFLMDGLVVAPEARGAGVGTALLEAFASEGKLRGYGVIRLDVAAGNLGARRLYERNGFEETATIRMGWLRHVFGYGAATVMVRDV